MDDKLLMENYLLILKSTVEVYVHGTLESSNDEIRKILNCGLDDTLKHQASCYEQMKKYGWYQINNIDKKSIKQVYNNLINE